MAMLLVLLTSLLIPQAGGLQATVLEVPSDETNFGIPWIQSGSFRVEVNLTGHSTPRLVVVDVADTKRSGDTVGAVITSQATSDTIPVAGVAYANVTSEYSMQWKRSRHVLVSHLDRIVLSNIPTCSVVAISTAGGVPLDGKVVAQDTTSEGTLDLGGGPCPEESWIRYAVVGALLLLFLASGVAAIVDTRKARRVVPQQTPDEVAAAPPIPSPDPPHTLSPPSLFQPVRLHTDDAVEPTDEVTVYTEHTAPAPRTVIRVERSAPTAPLGIVYSGRKVVEVKPGKPAEQCGLKKGMVLVSVKGIAVETAHDVKVAFAGAGAVFDVEVEEEEEEEEETALESPPPANDSGDLRRGSQHNAWDSLSGDDDGHDGEVVAALPWDEAQPGPSQQGGEEEEEKAAVAVEEKAFPLPPPRPSTTPIHINPLRSHPLFLPRWTSSAVAYPIPTAGSPPPPQLLLSRHLLFLTALAYLSLAGAVWCPLGVDPVHSLPYPIGILPLSAILAVVLLVPAAILERILHLPLATLPYCPERDRDRMWVERQWYTWSPWYDPLPPYPWKVLLDDRSCGTGSRPATVGPSAVALSVESSRPASHSSRERLLSRQGVPELAQDVPTSDQVEEFGQPDTAPDAVEEYREAFTAWGQNYAGHHPAGYPGGMQQPPPLHHVMAARMEQRQPHRPVAFGNPFSIHRGRGGFYQPNRVYPGGGRG
eukprot:Sspe_Gene.118086::Locus_110733_Transcript_1_1_Confidence_1.000_Length_2199::g.118086::m.118086